MKAAYRLPIASVTVLALVGVGHTVPAMEVTIENVGQLDGDAKIFADSAWRAYDESVYDTQYSRESFALVARDANGETIGTATGWLSMGVGYLSELIVQPERRQMGIGGKLLSAFERLASSTDHHRLALRTERDGRAREMYAKAGWHIEATLENWLGGKTFVQMRKDLPKSASVD